MTATIATVTGGSLPTETYDLGGFLGHKMPPVEWSTFPAQVGRALGTQSEVRIEPYAPYLIAPNGWLSLLEARVRNSVLPDEYRGEPSTEWLTEGAANAAIAFFRAGADLFPVEPHIYATRSGDLVAEFDTPTIKLTSVVSASETILFAVLRNRPGNPLERVIRRDSGQLRDELRSFIEKITAASHGEMAAAG